MYACAAHGADTGLSQMAYASNQQDDIIFNFPIDISFKSTNPFGWPRIVLSVYGLDALGRDVIRGYGSVHLPTCAGSTTRDVPLFKPLSSSLLQQFTAWLTGSPPEYFDAKFITQNDGREVTRVCSTGKVRLVLNVVTSGMKKYGYASG
uniref:B9 domain-containing protein 1 n=1 Tax=Globisporangium ultimum (strain ATCC 200006 / CBS 805.95 / DAOM BR144) TaxID=431595 RepID=K3WSI9_GLOUD